MTRRLVIATRQSPLALWQANHVKDLLEARHAALRVELLEMTTRGEQWLDSPLSRMGGKGLFVKELEHALLDGRADLAVHSMKDMPARQPDGLHVSSILKRENPRDAFVSNNFYSPADLPQGARVGTCSLRRQAQLRSLFPDIEVHNLRGNVNSRLARLDAGEFDAIVLAAAGLMSLGMSDRIMSELPIDCSLPAAGQGVIGIECRVDDNDTNYCVSALHDHVTAARVTAERALSARLDGGCQVPIGAFALVRGNQLWLRGLVATPDGRDILRAEDSAPVAYASTLGTRLAEQLMQQGAGRILNSLGLNPLPLVATADQPSFRHSGQLTA